LLTWAICSVKVQALMNILAIIAVLTGSNFSTLCTQTQVNGKSGYVIETLSFNQTSSDERAPLNLTVTRSWFSDEKCASEVTSEDKLGMQVSLGEEIKNVFGTENEIVLEANYSSTVKTELGALSISKDQSSVRIARGFGNFRNTMLSVINYKK
jgi:hypothetical protein